MSGLFVQSLVKSTDVEFEMTEMNSNTMAMIVKTYEHDGQMLNVSFTEAGFFNATAVAKTFGKSPKDWLRTDDTKAYINAIRRKCLLDENQLVIIKNGSPENGGGTWLHPKLGVPFARWCNVDFAVWADEQIEDILKGKSSFQLPKTFSEALQLAADQAKQIEKQQKQIEAAKPMIEFHEEVSQSETEYTVSRVAKILFNGSMKDTELREWLKNNGWMDRRKGFNEPTVWSIRQEYMRLRLRQQVSTGKFVDVPVITSKGFVLLRHLHRTGDLFLSSIDQVRCLPQPEYRV